MLQLRSYQNQAICALRSKIKEGNKKLILCAPTGSGKTFVFSYLIHSAVSRKRKCLILTHRSELLMQAGGSLANLGLTPIEIKPGKSIPNPSHLVLAVGMAQTIKRRISKPEYKKWLSELDIVIIDEAHTQDTELLLPYLGQHTIVIGATATPYRELNQTPLDNFYQSIVEVISIPELVSQGFLAKPHTYGVKVDLAGIKTKGGDFDANQMGDRYSKTKIYEGVYENYTRLTPNKKAIIFAANVQSSKDLVADFQAKGLPIKHLDGTTPTGERKQILKWFKNTPNAIISNVGILNAGFDEPTIEVVILYRATKSLPLMLQMCGRGSRVIPGVKDSFTILDFGNNIHRHGFWEDKRQWSLAPPKKKRKGEQEAPVKSCPQCTAIVYASTRTCNYCGHEFQPTEKEIEEAEIAVLQKLSYAEIQAKLPTANFKELEQIAKAKNYAKGWIFHQLRTEADIRAYAKYKGYKPHWITRQKELRGI